MKMSLGNQLEAIEIGFYSNYFLVPKKGRGWKPILNLRNLNNQLQNDGTSHHNSNLRLWKLVHCPQPSGCLLPCSHPPTTQVFPKICDKGRSLSILSSPLWTLCILEDVHKDSLSGSNLSMSMRNISVPMSGQLASQVSVTSRCPGDHIQNINIIPASRHLLQTKQLSYLKFRE